MKRIRDMKKVCGLWVIMALLMTASGCVTVTYPVSPNISGKVIDKKNREAGFQRANSPLH
jgi:hypothetical protein